MKILVIEDEIGIADFLKQGLEEEGYQVIIANDGLLGLEMYNLHKPDLVLLDWMLPKILGLNVCRTIRETDSKTPIIFLTANDTVQDTIEGLKSGANDYIKKPFSFEELLLRIKLQMRVPDPLTDNYVLGTIEINTNTHQVFNNNIEIQLTQKEYSLLTYLIKNKGKVCTRNQIIQDVWNIYFEYDTGVIDVFINAIRKKLDFKKENDYIKTIRGVGYIASEIN